VPSIYSLKPRFQALLRPLTRALARGGITANHVTLSACILSVALGLWLTLRTDDRRLLLILPAFLFARMALNAIDGMLAREWNQKSRLGAILNELGDVVSDTALYLPFAIVPGVSAILVALTVALAVMTEMTGVVAIQIGAARRYDGPFGKSDRALAFGTLAFVLGIGIRAGLWTNIVFALAALAAALTIFNRARAALRNAQP